MNRLLAWLFRDPNLDRRPDWKPRPVTVPEQACIMCPAPALQDGLCGTHGGLPWNQWPAEAQARLVDEIRRGDS